MNTINLTQLDSDQPDDIFDNEWYVVAPSSAVNSKKPFRAQLHHQRLVLWRTSNGEVTVLNDRCPHLGASLSAGRLSNDEVICPYHGMRYNAEGSCTHLPGQPNNSDIPDKLSVRRWQIQEADGWIYVLWAEQHSNNIPPLQRFDAIATIPAWASIKCTVRDWPVHYTRAGENTLDSLHFFEVHRISMPFGQNAESEFDIETEGNRITSTTFREGIATGPTHSLMYPNLWFQNWGKMGGVSIAIVPMGDSSRLYIRSMISLTRIPLLKHALGTGMHWMWVFALWQDSKVVFEQSPHSVDDANDVLIGYDKPIIAYRKIRRASQQAATKLINSL